MEKEILKILYTNDRWKKKLYYTRNISKRTLYWTLDLQQKAKGLGKLEDFGSIYKRLS